MSNLLLILSWPHNPLTTSMPFICQELVQQNTFVFHKDKMPPNLPFDTFAAHPKSPSPQTALQISSFTFSNLVSWMQQNSTLWIQISSCTSFLLIMFPKSHMLYNKIFVIQHLWFSPCLLPIFLFPAIVYLPTISASLMFPTRSPNLPRFFCLFLRLSWFPLIFTQSCLPLFDLSPISPGESISLTNYFHEFLSIWIDEELSLFDFFLWLFLLGSSLWVDWIGGWLTDSDLKIRGFVFKACCEIVWVREFGDWFCTMETEREWVGWG